MNPRVLYKARLEQIWTRGLKPFIPLALSCSLRVMDLNIQFGGKLYTTVMMWRIITAASKWEKRWCGVIFHSHHSFYMSKEILSSQPITFCLLLYVTAGPICMWKCWCKGGNKHKGNGNVTGISFSQMILFCQVN